MPKKLTYTSAMTELQDLVQGLEDGTVDIDALPKAVERAATLVQFCRQKLRNTEDALEKLLTDEV